MFRSSIKALSLFLSFLLLSEGAFSAGSRRFSGTDVVDFGSGASLDSVMGDQGTIIMMVSHNAIPGAANGSYARKGAFTTFNLTTSVLQFTMPRATQSQLGSASFSNFSNWNTGKYNCVVAVYSPNGIAGDQRLYVGNSTAPASEPSAYVTQRTGSGAITDSTAGDYLVGNNTTGTLPHNGGTEKIGHWNRLLTPVEIQNQCFCMTVSTGMVLFSHLGRYVPTDYDDSLSGNNSISITGTTPAIESSYNNEYAGMGY